MVAVSSRDWYAQRLAQARQEQYGTPAPQTAPQYPPIAPPAPGQLPAHLAPYAQPQPQQQYATQPQPGNGQYGPQGTPQAPPAQPPGQQFISYNAETGAAVADDGHVALLYNSAAQTGGSNVVRQNSTQCPNCAGGNYFTVQEGGVMNRDGHTVRAMQCADCGFPKVQAGSHGGALGTARSAGPAKAARQLAPDHRVTVTLPGGQTATFDPPTGSR